MREVNAVARAVGGFLLARRHELGLKQREVGFRAGISHTSMVRFEKGQRPVQSVAVTAKLAKALEVNPYGLVAMVADGKAKLDRSVSLSSIVDQLACSYVCDLHEPECLAELIFLLRANARKDCEEAAAAAGLHVRSWDKLERNEYRPSIPVLVRIAERLGSGSEAYRVPLLGLAMRDQLRRQHYERKGETWKPRWTRPPRSRRWSR